MVSVNCTNFMYYKLKEIFSVNKVNLSYVVLLAGYGKRRYIVRGRGVGRGAWEWKKGSYKILNSSLEL